MTGRRHHREASTGRDRSGGAVLGLFFREWQVIIVTISDIGFIVVVVTIAKSARFFFIAIGECVLWTQCGRCIIVRDDRTNDESRTTITRHLNTLFVVIGFVAIGCCTRQRHTTPCGWWCGRWTGRPANHHALPFQYPFPVLVVLPGTPVQRGGEFQLPRKGIVLYVRRRFADAFIRRIVFRRLVVSGSTRSQETRTDRLPLQLGSDRCDTFPLTFALRALLHDLLDPAMSIHTKTCQSKSDQQESEHDRHHRRTLLPFRFYARFGCRDLCGSCGTAGRS